jgi:hypothetical protein
VHGWKLSREGIFAAGVRGGALGGFALQETPDHHPAAVLGPPMEFPKPVLETLRPMHFLRYTTEEGKAFVFGLEPHGIAG